ncbi:hypothetical protein BSKO_06670 [Bryopsis sp. KO-2023]|nr:hypothetical protein BSKO_06670 [Bryopsis sp. KO-2023]
MQGCRTAAATRSGFWGRGFPGRTSQRVCRRRDSKAVQSLLKPSDSSKASWWQNPEEVYIRLRVDDSIRGKDIDFELHPTRLRLSAREETLLEGYYDDAGEVDIDGSFWEIEEEDGEKSVLITLLKQTMGHMSFEDLFEMDRVNTTFTNWVYMDYVLKGKDDEGLETSRMLGRVFYGLYGSAMPASTKRFCQLCTGEMGEHSSGELYWYRGTRLHTIIPGDRIEGGDILSGDGSGRLFEDIPKGFKKLEDDVNKIKFTKKGMLGMKDSLFCVGWEPNPDSKVAVIGRVFDDPSMSILGQICEIAGSQTGDPSREIMISDCGVIEEENLETMVAEERQRRILAPVDEDTRDIDMQDDIVGKMDEFSGSFGSSPQTGGFKPIDFGE